MAMRTREDQRAALLPNICFMRRVSFSMIWGACSFLPRVFAAGRGSSPNFFPLLSEDMSRISPEPEAEGQRLRQDERVALGRQAHQGQERLHQHQEQDQVDGDLGPEPELALAPIMKAAAARGSRDLLRPVHGDLLLHSKNPHGVGDHREPVGAAVAVLPIPGEVHPTVFGRAASSHEIELQHHSPPSCTSMHLRAPDGRACGDGDGKAKGTPSRSGTPITSSSSCPRPSSGRLRHWMAMCGKVLFLSAFVCQTALLRHFAELGRDTAANQESSADGTTTCLLVTTRTTPGPAQAEAEAERQPFLSSSTSSWSTTTTSLMSDLLGPGGVAPPGGAALRSSWGQERPQGQEDYRRRMFAADVIGRLRMLSMRPLVVAPQAEAQLDVEVDEDENYNSSNPQHQHSSTRRGGNTNNNTTMTRGVELEDEERMCLHDLEELAVLEQACIINIILFGEVVDEDDVVPPRRTASTIRNDGPTVPPTSFLRRRPPGTTADESGDQRKGEIELESLTSSLSRLQLSEQRKRDETSFARPSPSSATSRKVGPASETETKSGRGRRLGRECSERELFQVASRRCEAHRCEAQRMKWSEPLQAISEHVAQDLQAWATRHGVLGPSETSGGSSRRLAAPELQRFAETVASIHELDQVLAKLRRVRLNVSGDQGCLANAGSTLPLLWGELPFSVRCALLRASTVCAIGSLLYVLNVHKLVRAVLQTVRSSCSSSSSCTCTATTTSTSRTKSESQAELRDEEDDQSQEQEVGETAEAVAHQQPSPLDAPPALSRAAPILDEAQQAAPPSPQPDAQWETSSKGSGKSKNVSERSSSSRALSASQISFFQEIPTSISEVWRNGERGAAYRALFHGQWQLQRLENFRDEFYPAKSPKLQNVRRHMSGFRIFGDLMEDLWGGEPGEIFFVRLRKLQRRLLWMDRMQRHFDAAEYEAFRAAEWPTLPPPRARSSAVDFEVPLADEVPHTRSHSAQESREAASSPSPGGPSRTSQAGPSSSSSFTQFLAVPAAEPASPRPASAYAASELLSERDEVFSLSSTTSACRHAESLERAEETSPEGRPRSPSAFDRIELDRNEWGNYLLLPFDEQPETATRADQQHDERGRLKRETVELEPLVAFVGSAGEDYLRDIGCFEGVGEGEGRNYSGKSMLMMHLEKRPLFGLDPGCSGRRVVATAAAGRAQNEFCAPAKDEDDEVELVITRLPPGFGNAEVIEALPHTAGAGRAGSAEGEADRADGSGTESPRPLTSLPPREVYRRTKGVARFVPLLQRRQ